MATETEFARRDPQGQVLVRGEPMRLRWSLDNLVTQDGHRLACTYECTACALKSAAERQLLEEVFLASSMRATSGDVVRHFHGALRAAAAGAVEARPVADAMGDSGKAALLEVLKAAANRVAFACGLELLGPFQVAVESPTLERQRLDAMERAMADQRAAGQLESLVRAGKVLAQFREMQMASPGLSPGEILKQLSPADQGDILRQLLLASSKDTVTSMLFAVAGPNLVKLDPRKNPPSCLVQPLPPRLGPLRSVQRIAHEEHPALLVGARSGVYLMHIDGALDPKPFTDPFVQTQQGFSRAILWNGQIVACHSDAGVVAWSLEAPDTPWFAARPADAMGGAPPRNLQSIDNARLVFSAGPRLYLLSYTTASGPPSFTLANIAGDARGEIVAILMEPGRIICVAKDGTIQTRDTATLAMTGESRRCGEVSSACLLPWLGASRLLLATEEGPVFCVGLDDDVVTQYLSPYRGLRSLAATSDLIAALSGDRQRLILWHPHAARSPASDLFLIPIAHHRAADVDF